MLCPNCNSTMTCLFVSYVCDRCNPPASSALPNKTKTNNTVDSDYKIGYFLIRRMAPLSAAYGCRVLVFECEQDAWNHYFGYANTNKNCRAEKVKVRPDFEWGSDIVIVNDKHPSWVSSKCSVGFGALVLE